MMLSKTFINIETDEGADGTVVCILTEKCVASTANCMLLLEGNKVLCELITLLLTLLLKH